MISGDSMGDRLVVEVYSHGIPFNLSGSITATIILPSGETVMPSVGGITDGNTAIVDLPAAAYSIPGMIRITIKNTGEDYSTTLIQVVATVVRSETGTVIDPSSVLPDLSTLRTAAQTANAAAAAASAATKGALPKVATAFESGGVTTANGSLSTMARRLRYTRTSAPQVQSGDYIYLDPVYKCYLALYNDSVFDNAHFVGLLSPGNPELIPAGGTVDWGSGAIPIPEIAFGKYLMVTIAKVGHETESIADDALAMQNLCLYMRPSLIAMVSDIPPLDATLTETGQAAEAAATGQAIEALRTATETSISSMASAHSVDMDKLKGRIDSYVRDHRLSLNALDFQWTLGKTILASGSISDNAKYALTDMFTVSEGETFINRTGNVGTDGKITATMVAAYEGETFKKRVTLDADAAYRVPYGVTGLRIVYGYTTANVDAPNMTSELLEQYFTVQLVSANERGDGTRPVLLAFGASTTAGVVHYLNENQEHKTRRSKNNWPDYMAKVYGMEGHNLARGSTGFVKRGDTDSDYYGDVDEYPNICDSILKNRDLLRRADLVVIHFGYGNDHFFGTDGSGNDISLPIGTYTDYFDYYAASRLPGYSSSEWMLQIVQSTGATLMGCLNWCLHYINTYAPFAQVVIVFGSPSANQARTASLSGNGPAKTIQFTETDPYQSAPSGSAEHGIYEIETQLNLLKEKLGIKVVDLFYDGNAFEAWNSYARDPEDTSSYALFSTVGTDATTGQPKWNSHPNDAGYLYYSRYLCGRIAELFRH